MNTMRRWKKRLSNHGLLCTAAFTFLIVVAVTQAVPPPVLTIAPTNGTQFLISITNAVATTNYEIYRTPVLLNTNFPWLLHIVGDVGQSNFVVDMQAEPMGYFRAGVGSDWDADGVPNSMDANPNDPTIGALTITIDSPTNGATLN